MGYCVLIHKYGEEAYLSLYDDIAEMGFEEAFVKNFGISSYKLRYASSPYL
jgi:hypothetical protein